MSHLGSRISALADGQLSPADAERALAHVATCPQCAAGLEAARSARRAVASADVVAPTADLTARLLSLAGPAPRGAGDDWVDPFAAGDRSGAPRRSTERFGRDVPPHTLTGDLTGRHPGWRLAAGSLVGLGAVAVVLFVMGDGPAVRPSDASARSFTLLGQATSLQAAVATAPMTVHAQDASDTTVGETWRQVARDAADSGTVTGGTDYLAWMRAHGWTAPAQVPAGWSVTSVRRLDDTLEVDLAGPAGTLVLSERHGRLDTDALAPAERQVVADRVVYVLSSRPWHAAWQSGDTVVEAVSPVCSDEAQAALAQFPIAGYDEGVSARIRRGWGTMTQAFTQP